MEVLQIIHVTLYGRKSYPPDRTNKSLLVLAFLLYFLTFTREASLIWWGMIFLRMTQLLEKVLIGVEINQDYIEVSSHTMYQIPPERMDITDKKMNDTSSLIEEYIRAKYSEKFAPFANIIVELSPIDENWIDSSMKTLQCIGIKLVAKADNADHIPPIENISIIASEVHYIVQKELLAK
jgi:hypothetical protein